MIRTDERRGAGVDRGAQAREIGRGQIDVTQVDDVRQDEVVNDRPERANEGGARPRIAIDERVESAAGHTRSSFRYRMRCGWSASAPRRSWRWRS